VQVVLFCQQLLIICHFEQIVLLLLAVITAYLTAAPSYSFMSNDTQNHMTVFYSFWSTSFAIFSVLVHICFSTGTQNAAYQVDIAPLGMDVLNTLLPGAGRVSRGVLQLSLQHSACLA